jgi:hypothetical protein
LLVPAFHDKFGLEQRRAKNGNKKASVDCQSSEHTAGMFDYAVMERLGQLTHIPVMDMRTLYFSPTPSGIT